MVGAGQPDILSVSSAATAGLKTSRGRRRPEVPFGPEGVVGARPKGSRCRVARSSGSARQQLCRGAGGRSGFVGEPGRGVYCGLDAPLSVLTCSGPTWAAVCSSVLAPSR
jgi:hypothetical protein